MRVSFLKATAATLVVAASAATLAVPVPAYAAAPTAVTAWYMFGTTPSALESAAASDGCTFASHEPGGSQIMLLDFGAARNNGSGSGTVDFSNVLVGNGTILAALERASDGVHNCYKTGTIIITYGNSNFDLTSTGTDAYRAGKYQEGRANSLASFEKSNGRTDQAAAAASDMEPSWDTYGKTQQLVKGATATGGVRYFDFGSADGCPTSGSGGSCNNGWTVADVGYVSAHGVARPVPEIYPPISTLAAQWTVIRRNWNANHTSSYTFAGVDGAPGNAQAGWDALAANNTVDRKLLCFGCNPS